MRAVSGTRAGDCPSAAAPHGRQQHPETARRVLWPGSLPHPADAPRRSGREAPRGRILDRQGGRAARPRREDTVRRGTRCRATARALGRGDHRTPHPGARYRALDGGNAADLRTRPRRRPAGGRLRSARGLSRGLRSRAHAAPQGARRVGRALAALSKYGRLVSVAGDRARARRQAAASPRAHPTPAPRPGAPSAAAATAGTAGLARFPAQRGHASHSGG